MRHLVALSLSVLLAFPVAAETVVSETTGTWQGDPMDGAAFRARLTSNAEDMVRLQLWLESGQTLPDGTGEAALDSPDIALATFATRQEATAVDTDTGTVLRVTTEYSDENAKGTTVVDIQYVDNDYRVVGFSNTDTFHADGYVTTCTLDFRAGTATEDGTTRDLPEIAPEDLLARDWTYNTPYDRNYCTAE